MIASDQLVREQALDVSQSCIVQAPAGSGKTELLIQRYLSLMAVVNEPEEVLAITFTRKAVTEMRNRVIDALTRSQQPEPDSPHARLTWRLAGNALAHSDECDWNILKQTSRLRIMTIDSLNTSLVRAMPWLSGIGADASLKQAPQYLYEEAVWYVMDATKADEKTGEALRRLLLHLDNNDRRVVGLLCELLARRDQWLRHLMPLKQLSNMQDIRCSLTDMFERVIEKELNDMTEALPASLGQDMVDVARESARRLLEAGEEKAEHIDCHDLHALPGTDMVDVPLWQALACLFLTEAGSWRKPGGINKKQGFGAGQAGKQDKERYALIYNRLVDNEDLLLKFNNIKKLPHVIYNERQWQLLEALVTLLPVCAAHLRLVFQRHGAMDFVEQALAARQAIGDSEQITDLAMRLDYSIRHILMDEFQDTSHSQLNLLEKLLEGWQPDDGHSLFLVGDPMQSIYRFREADVSGFLKVRDRGIAAIRPQSLILKSNFRSTPILVRWFNDIFPGILAERDDLSLGGVSYSPAVSAVEDNANSGVHVHAQPDRKQEDEARQVVEIVHQYLRDEPDNTIGILARSRSHLSLIHDRLLMEGIPFQAVEIFSLSGLAVIQDWVSVTRSLLHRHDRIAWLAVLRAPWCGLTLDSLHRLCADEPDKDLWQLINNVERQSRLVDDEQQRLWRVIQAYRQVFNHAGHLTFRTRLEWLWKLLGADQCHAGSGQDIEACFDLLEQLEQGSQITLKSIERGLEGLYSTVGNDSNCRVQLMTIHKSKGMQFDTVILPGLERATRADKEPLLTWHEEISADYEKKLLLAPIYAQGSDDASFDFVKGREEQRKNYETQRLLYVAATRARQHLHLFATLSTGRKGDKLFRPRAGSFLGFLESHLRNEFTTETAGEPDDVIEEGAGQAVVFNRVAVDWCPAVAAANIDWQQALSRAQDEEPVEFSWAGQSARLVGIVVHQYLRQFAETGTEQWSSSTVQSQHDAVSASLQSSGSLPEGRLEDAVERVIKILNNVMHSDRGRWLLAPHSDAQSEYAVSGVLNQQVISRVIDRTFIDDSGVRWIVDYKTGSHEGGNLAGFLDEEQHRYRPQLEEYAAMLSVSSSQEIRLGLYFPLMDGWREWTYESFS